MHYPLVSAAKMPSPANARRWQRHEIDLPVHVVLHNEVSRMLVPGRGTEISEGGMALYAGIHLKPNELMEIEFLTPCHAQVSRKLHAGNLHVQFERRTEASAQARLLRPDCSKWGQRRGVDVHQLLRVQIDKPTPVQDRFRQVQVLS